MSPFYIVGNILLVQCLENLVSGPRSYIICEQSIPALISVMAEDRVMERKAL